MALVNQRVYHIDGATLEDKSVSANSIFADAATVDIASGEYLYVGSDLPFNHRYFKVSTANTNSASLTVQIWNGEWVDAVDVIDQTTASGRALSQNGILSWTTPKNEAWQQEDTENIAALSTLRIYGFYWVRIGVSASLSATTAVQYIGHKFATDDDLGGYYPNLVASSVMSAYESGKTDWDEQHLLAAEEIVQDVRRRGIAWNANQILDWEQFRIAAVHRVAANIMIPFGADYRDDRAVALKDYEKAMNLKIFTAVDLNEDGRVDDDERRPFTGLHRS